MTGRLELSEPSNEHVCALPEIRTWDPEVVMMDAGPMTGLPIVHTLPVGTRFHCECGKVWVVHMEPARAGRVSHEVWDHETRAERRARLGLRWWQRDRA